MKLIPKQLAVGAALVGLLAAGAALPATAAAPLSAPAAITMPWSAVPAESIAPGAYADTMTVGTAQQLTPDILPEKAARRAKVSYVSDAPGVITVTSDGVAQAVGLGTAHITATVNGLSCEYIITSEPDESMIITEMDLTLASNTIAVGDTTSLSLAVLPTTAAGYADVKLTSSNEKVATVNNFGKVTGVGVGTATITATSGDVSCSATVRVVNANSGTSTAQSIRLSTSYVVLKPGATKTITGKVTPSSASQSLTFKSNDTKVAKVSSGGVVTGVASGATSIVVSNGVASASVTVIVNQNASASGSSDVPADTTSPDGTVDAIAALIQSTEGSEVLLTQAEAPVITPEALNALRLSGKTLVVTATDYSLRLAAEDIRNTSAPLDTKLAFAATEQGVRFTLNNGQPLPGTVELRLGGENGSYGRLYLYNTVSEKWQFLNAYADGSLKADTAGDYLLTNENLRFAEMDWTFFIAGAVVMLGIIVAYIAVKKRYWFW